MVSQDDAWEHISRYETAVWSAPIPTVDGPSLGTKRNLSTGQRENARSLLLQYLESDVEAKLRPKLARLSPKKRTPILVLGVNAGVLDLVLNFLCSARRLALRTGQNPISSLIVFAGDEEVLAAMDALGVESFYHPGLGEFPRTSSVGYGDDVFTQMMWLKVTCVYSVLRLGYDCIFQDADVVWFRDPVPWLLAGAAEHGGREYDAFFQNDGARSQRYAPFSANTGFSFALLLVPSSSRAPRSMPTFFEELAAAWE